MLLTGAPFFVFWKKNRKIIMCLNGMSTAAMDLRAMQPSPTPCVLHIQIEHSFLPLKILRGFMSSIFLFFHLLFFPNSYYLRQFMCLNFYSNFLNYFSLFLCLLKLIGKGKKRRNSSGGWGALYLNFIFRKKFLPITQEK